MPRTITVLNGSGDTTIGWTESQDDKVKEWVEARMKEGFTFFFVEQGRDIRLKDFSDAVKNGRKIVVTDIDSDTLLWQVGVQVGFYSQRDPGDENDYKGGSAEIETTGRAKTAEDVVKADTVAVPPRAGG